MNEYGAAFSELLAHKLATLEGFVHELQEGITLRESLSQELRSWMEEQYAAIKAELLRLYAWQFPSNSIVEQRRHTLERSLEVLLSEQRQEAVLCLRDTESLRKELRQWQKQHDDLVQRITLLAGARY